jgi:hypothetical protein
MLECPFKSDGMRMKSADFWAGAAVAILTITPVVVAVRVQLAGGDRFSISLGKIDQALVVAWWWLTGG